jgi:iron complex outermembrane receptor protein
VDCSGLRALRSPEWVFAANLEQTFELARGGRIVAQVFTRYEGAREFDIAYIPETRAGGAMRTDLVVGYEAASGRWGVSAFVNNIENNAVLSNATPNPSYSANGVVAATLRPPRTYGVRLSSRF